MTAHLQVKFDGDNPMYPLTRQLLVTHVEGPQEPPNHLYLKQMAPVAELAHIDPQATFDLVDALVAMGATLARLLAYKLNQDRPEDLEATTPAWCIQTVYDQLTSPPTDDAD